MKNLLISKSFSYEIVDVALGVTIPYNREN